METPGNTAIALQGCIHGEMNNCFDSIEEIIDEGKWQIPLLLWSGDVQTIRSEEDLYTLACPPKFRALKDFYQYYNTEKVAPCLTLFIGGNHESSAFLHPLWFGGWVAPHMYYFGRSGVVTIKENRIVGLSGIYKYHDYAKGYHERPPFNAQTIRSVYHVRNIEIKRLKHLRGPVKVMLTHDWPTQIIQKPEDQQALLRKKPYFREDLQNGRLGNPHLMDLLLALKPPIWVAAHLHVNFQCTFEHDKEVVTRFVTHDKPKRNVSTSLLDTESNHLHFCYRPDKLSGPEPQVKRRRCEARAIEDIMIDLEWLLILKASWSETVVGDQRADLTEERYTYTWGDAKRLASLVEAKGLANWRSELQLQQKDLRDDDIIPDSVELWKYSFSYPSWDVLDYRNPWRQTAWWFEILGIPNDDIHPPYKAPGGPTDVGSEVEEEEDIDLI